MIFLEQFLKKMLVLDKVSFTLTFFVFLGLSGK